MTRTIGVLAALVALLAISMAIAVLVGAVPISPADVARSLAGGSDGPTGTIVRRGAVERFLDRVPKAALVVMDEAYFEYVEDPEYPDGLEYVRQGRNVVVLRTFSKIYGLAGLRVGYGIAPPEVCQALHQVREPFNVYLVAQEAAIASLDDPDQVTRARRANAEGREYLNAAFASLGLAPVPTQANFILVDLGRESRPVYEALLRRGVIVRDGTGLGLPTHLRVTTGTRPQNERLIATLREVLG